MALVKALVKSGNFSSHSSPFLSHPPLFDSDLLIAPPRRVDDYYVASGGALHLVWGLGVVGALRPVVAPLAGPFSGLGAPARPKQQTRLSEEASQHSQQDLSLFPFPFSLYPLLVFLAVIARILLLELAKLCCARGISTRRESEGV